MSKDVHKIIKSEYEKRQKAAFDNLLSKTSEAYKKLPRLEEIDSRIQLSGIKYNKMILLGADQSVEASAELISEIDQLKAEKVRILSESGYPKDFLESNYECNLCRDTGFVEGRNGSDKCTCYKQLLIDNLYYQSNLKLAESENFSSFDESYYPDIVNEKKYGIKISPRENILKIKKRCLEFIENFTSSNEKNLFFSGPTGVGKTFISNCIANELLNTGRTVLYQTAPTLFDTISEYKMKAFKDEGFEDLSYKNIFDVELLIIDDLGTESPSPSRFTELLNILNIRQINNLSKPQKTIISTNIEAKELYNYYKERVASRIIGNFDMFRFAGEDIRSVRKFKQK